MSSVDFEFTDPRSREPVKFSVKSESLQPFSFFQESLFAWFDAHSLSARCRLHFTNSNGDVLTPSTQIKGRETAIIAGIIIHFLHPFDLATSYEQLCTFPLTEDSCMKAAHRILDAYFQHPVVVFPPVGLSDPCDLSQLPWHFSLKLTSSDTTLCELWHCNKLLTPFVVLGWIPAKPDRQFQLELSNVARKALDFPHSYAAKFLTDFTVRHVDGPRYDLVIANDLHADLYYYRIEGVNGLFSLVDVEGVPFLKSRVSRFRALLVKRVRADFLWASDEEPSIEVAKNSHPSTREKPIVVRFAGARLLTLRLPTGREVRMFQPDKAPIDAARIAELGAKFMSAKCGWATTDNSSL
jgi:hypothetical protein